MDGIVRRLVSRIFIAALMLLVKHTMFVICIDIKIIYTISLENIIYN